MMKNAIKTFFVSIVLILMSLTACNRPKVIDASNASAGEEESTGIFSDAPSGNSTTKPTPSKSSPVKKDMHKVVIKEVLPTSKYVYLHAKEDDKVFWIATRKQEVKIGDTYLYKGGLLKTNFESKEYNRTFDTVYLVSNLVPANHSLTGKVSTGSKISLPPAKKTKLGASKKIEVDGSVKIADIVAHPQNYEGKTIQISGECVKLNANIMGRNWMHLRDGSKDDFDLVVTSDVAIPEGHITTMTATVALNKDFGAGYKYDIILENGTLITMQ